jgi:hypothetical protein
VDGSHRRPLAAHADQRSDDAGSWLSQALAVRTGYRAQPIVATIGAVGATALTIAWAVQRATGH